MENKKNTENIFNHFNSSQNHWFLTRHQTEELTHRPIAINHRLNELDTNILENSQEIDYQTQSLKLEYLIKEREEQLFELNKKINFAEHAGDQQELFTNRAKKNRIETELKDLKQQIAAREVNTVTAPKSFTKKFPALVTFKRFIQRYFLAKISKKVNSLVMLSDSLEALQDINTNVDDLIKIKAPYGETVRNYERLTEYLSRANKIHSQISKTIKR